MRPFVTHIHIQKLEPDRFWQLISPEKPVCHSFKGNASNAFIDSPYNVFKWNHWLDVVQNDVDADVMAAVQYLFFNCNSSPNVAGLMNRSFLIRCDIYSSQKYK